MKQPIIDDGFRADRHGLDALATTRPNQPGDIGWTAPMPRLITLCLQIRASDRFESACQSSSISSLHQSWLPINHQFRAEQIPKNSILLKCC